MSDVQMVQARAALRTAISELWLLENAVPKQDKEEQIERLKTAVRSGGLLGVVPSLPWSQMRGDFAVPTDPMMRLSSNLERFSGNYLNVIIAGALFTTFIRNPARISALLACNGFATLAPSSVYEDALKILRTHFSSSFLRKFTAAELQYASVWIAQVFLALAHVLSRRGRRGFFIGSLLACAHAALLARPARPTVEIAAVAMRRVEENNAAKSEKKGSIAFTLVWDQPAGSSTRNDLDLWVTTPDGEKIAYDHTSSQCGGKLDVDKRQSADNPVENIVWTENAPSGIYKIEVENFTANADCKPVDFQVVMIQDGGEPKVFQCRMPGREKSVVHVHDFQYIAP